MENSDINVAYHRTLKPVWCNGEEYEKLLKTGNWFDCPNKAKAPVKKKPEKKLEKKLETEQHDTDQPNS